MRERGVEPSGVFLDLGISSPQFDDASRGFRPEEDGPLDLRFDATAGESAYEFLQRVEAVFRFTRAGRQVGLRAVLIPPKFCTVYSRLYIR